jgi:hypothetical protein
MRVQQWRIQDFEVGGTMASAKREPIWGSGAEPQWDPGVKPIFSPRSYTTLNTESERSRPRGLICLLGRVVFEGGKPGKFPVTGRLRAPGGRCCDTAKTVFPPLVRTTNTTLPLGPSWLRHWSPVSLRVNTISGKLKFFSKPV